jgi:glucose-1-phosphate thymidylyltransferase
VKDIYFAIEKLQLNEDLLVVAGDNLLDFSLTKFIAYAKEKQTSCIMRYFEPQTEKLQKSGVVQTDEQDKVLQMQEKPQIPCSSWACPPFYYYVQKDVPLVKKGIDSGCGTDAPGSFIAWLCTQTEVHAMEMPGKRYDIGNLASYQQVQQAYKGITK